MKKYIITGLILLPLIALAGAGLGMSASTFNLGELKKGYCYDVGTVGVVNYQGDEMGTYHMSIAYHQDWPEIRTPADWVVFTPQTFMLEPSEWQTVGVDVCIPRNATKGDYGSFLVAEVESSGNVNPAVGTKLFFTVVNRRVK